MNSSPALTLVLVSGAPASGKSSIAARLATDLGLPLLAKDDIKELLADSLEVTTYEWSRRTGRASYALLDWLATKLLSAGQSLILEANFDRRYLTEWDFAQAVNEHNAKVVEIFCRADPTVLVHRYTERAKAGHRHPIHHDQEHLDGTLREEIAGDKFSQPLGLGAIIMVDTTHFDRVDYPNILTQVRSMIDQPQVARARVHEQEQQHGHSG